MYYYYLILALKIFCIYHVYKNHKPYYWFFVIIFLPVIGGIFYILTQVFSKKDAENFQSQITQTINPTKKTKGLEKRLQFADTYANRIALADAYVEIEDYSKAVENYLETLNDKVHDDLYTRQQLILCYFQLETYNEVISHSETIKNRTEFKASKQQFCYGLALKEMGKIEEAEEQLKAIDRPYSNYKERLELAKFYIENDNVKEGKNLLEAITEEAQHMTKTNKRLFRNTFVEAEKLLSTL